jgi:hypothetical protein
MIGVVALAGCATVQPLQTSRQESLASRFERMLDSIQVAGSLEPDEVVSAPRIRIVIPPATYASTRYVDASFHVSEDAYVLVVAVDLDGQLRVVYPEAPDQTGFAARSRPMRLTRFFAGFGGPRAGTWSRYEAQYAITQRISPFGGGGVLLAIASDRPLQYERLIGADGDWDEQQLAQIVFDQSLPGAAHALGRALVLTGQEYNTDYTTFAGRRFLGGYASLASNSYNGCSFNYGYDAFDTFGYGFGYGFPSYESGPVTRFVGFFRQGGQTYARYSNVGPCGRPVYHDVPVATPIPTAPDTTRHDSSATQRPRRFPDAPRFPSVTGDNDAAPRRLAPSNLRDSGRERPRVAAGLRFRPPEQVPSDPIRPLGRSMSPRDASDSPARRAPVSPEGPLMRPTTDRQHDAELSRATERYVPPQREERRAEAVRPEPARAEPARSEPVRSEPAHREPVHREPLPATPTLPTPR